MKRVIISMITCMLLSQFLHATQSSDTTRPLRIKNIAWFTPSNVDRINGLAIGLQAANLNDERPMSINGINADAGLLSMFFLAYAVHDEFASRKNRAIQMPSPDTVTNRINGISLSLGGIVDFSVNGITLNGIVVMTSYVNGISVSAMFSRLGVFRGISIAGIHNRAVKGRGIQIGILNDCTNLKGIQLGLWNRSGKRGLPFINWGF